MNFPLQALHLLMTLPVVVQEKNKKLSTPSIWLTVCQSHLEQLSEMKRGGNAFFFFFFHSKTNVVVVFFRELLPWFEATWSETATENIPKISEAVSF